MQLAVAARLHLGLLQVQCGLLNRVDDRSTRVVHRDRHRHAGRSGFDRFEAQDTTRVDVGEPMQHGLQCRHLELGETIRVGELNDRLLGIETFKFTREIGGRCLTFRVPVGVIADSAFHRPTRPFRTPKMRARQNRTFEAGIVQLGDRQFGVSEISSLKPAAAQMRAAKIGLHEARALGLDAMQVSLAEAHLKKVGAG